MRPISDKPDPDYAIIARRDAAIRRALSTPPVPTKKLIGTTERAQEMRESRVRKARQAKKETGEPSGSGA